MHVHTADCEAEVYARNPDIEYLHESAMVRRNQLLVSARHADQVHDRARRFVERRQDHAELGVTQLHLRENAGVDLAALVTELRGEPGSHRHFSVTLNHMMRGAPNWNGGPYGPPSVCEPLPPPTVVPVQREVTVGIVDTGIDPHPWFAEHGWFADCHNEVRETLDADLDYELDHQAGHGTFIAGVLMRHAPSARLRVERALESDGVTDELKILRGLARLYRRVTGTGEQLDVLNLSLGGYTFDDRPSPLISEALARIGRSTVIVAAAGNHNSDRPFWPAALKNVIGVAALTRNQFTVERAPFSDYGWWVDACAIGVDVSSTFVTFEDEDGPDFQGYATWSGTSFAAPRVAGAIAHLAATKDISAADAAELLLDPDTNVRIPDLGTVVTG